MNRIKLSIITLIVVFLVTIPIFLTPSSAQIAEQQKQKAETLLSILETNNKTISSELIKLDDQNISLGIMEDTFQLGLIQLREAQNLFNLEMYNESCNVAILALQNYETVLKEIENALSTEPTPTEIFANQIILIKANITRTYDFVLRLENLTNKIKIFGYKTDSIDRELLKIKGILKNATQNLRSLDIETAKENLITAKILLQNLNESISRLKNLVNEANTLTYLEDSETRISEIKTDINLSPSLTPEIKEEAITALNNSETNLENARELIEVKQVDDAIQKLEEAKKWEEESKRIIASVNETAIIDTNENKIDTQSETATP